jgi:hypothetical protein
MAQPESRIKFDKTINLGHVITIGVFLASLLLQWNMMDKRVAILEEFRLSQRDRDQAQDSAAKDKFQEVKDALIDLRHGIEKVADKVGASK